MVIKEFMRLPTGVKLGGAVVAGVTVPQPSPRVRRVLRRAHWVSVSRLASESQE